MLGTGKPAALLAYLALAPGRTVLREECVDLLWAHLDPDRAKSSLRQALFHLRSALGAETISSDGKRLTLGAILDVDLLDFRAAAEADDPRAIDLYRGPFMQGVSFPGGAVYEQWADLERARADALLMHAAEAIVQASLREGRLNDALGMARRTRDLRIRSQAAWRLLLETCLAVGDRPLALVESAVLARWLDEEDETPEPELAATLKRLQRARDSAPTSRERHETEFVGREREFAALLGAFHAVVGGKSRHVHVSGAAGFGKSRLLVEIAERYRALRARVATIAAVPSDRGLPFSLLARVAETVGVLPGAASVAPESAAVLVRLAPLLSSTFNASGGAHWSDDALARSQAVREMVDAVAAERHLVLMVDDLHWSDRESLDVLARLVDRLPPNVLLVTTARPPV
ncbi:MAG: AAA family ATPase, partial [Gemmatimonadota bacterium]